MASTEGPISQKLKPITKEYLTNIEKCQETILKIDDEMKQLIESIVKQFYIYIEIKDVDMKKRSIFVENSLKVVNALTNDINDIENMSNDINSRLSNIESKLDKRIQQQLNI